MNIAKALSSPAILRCILRHTSLRKDKNLLSFFKERFLPKKFSQTPPEEPPPPIKEPPATPSHRQRAIYRWLLGFPLNLYEEKTK